MYFAVVEVSPVQVLSTYHLVESTGKTQPAKDYGAMSADSDKFKTNDTIWTNELLDD